MLVREQERILNTFNYAWSAKVRDLRAANDKRNADIMDAVLASPKWQDNDALLVGLGFKKGITRNLAAYGRTDNALLSVFDRSVIGKREIDVDLKAAGWADLPPDGPRFNTLALAVTTCGKKWKDIATDVILFSSDLASATSIDEMNAAADRLVSALAR